MKKPLGIQIIGTQRSGSNLLRVILDQSKDIASPHPPHMLTTFVPLLPLYAPLDSEQYRLLVNDVVDFVYANPVPWEGIVLDKEVLFNASQCHSLYELNRLVYEQVAKGKGAKYWCCKSMANVHYADELENAAPNLKYIYLYRDGRDVAVSFKKAMVGDKHVYFLASKWKEDQEACISLAKKLGADRFFSLSYEALTDEPEKNMRALCAYLEIDYVPEMMDFYTSNTSKITAAAGEMWSNLAKPVMKNNTRKFLTELSSDELHLFEYVAGDTLQKLGYPLYGSNETDFSITPDLLSEYEKENRQMKQQTLLSVSKSDLEKRKPQAVLLEAIKKRNTHYRKKLL